MRETNAIYPGTFDPLTNGHLDIIERCSKLFDNVVIAILVNPEKETMFTDRERLDLIRQSIPAAIDNVEVDVFDGLLAEYASKKNADVIIRGIRAVSDYEYELQMALMNRRLQPDIETIFMLPAARYSYLSSHLVREVAEHGGSIQGLVPDPVEKALLERFE